MVEFDEVIVDDEWRDEQREQVGWGGLVDVVVVVVGGRQWSVGWCRGSLWWGVEAEHRGGEEGVSVAVVANERRCRLSARHHRRDPGSDRTPMPLVP